MSKSSFGQLGCVQHALRLTCQHSCSDCAASIPTCRHSAGLLLQDTLVYRRCMLIMRVICVTGTAGQAGLHPELLSGHQ